MFTSTEGITDQTGSSMHFLWVKATCSRQLLSSGRHGTKNQSQVGKHITSLEGVPPSVSSRATQLFLSNNSLGSLLGLESFSGVTCLSLAHNLVRRTEDLRPLAFLARLETLSLEGNPVCGAANYRAHVVTVASPCLKTLDDREVCMSLCSLYGVVFVFLLCFAITGDRRVGFGLRVPLHVVCGVNGTVQFVTGDLAGCVCVYLPFFVDLPLDVVPRKP